jgi:simple sugar transport system permease protein
MRLRIPPKYVPLLATVLVFGLLFLIGALRYPRFASLHVVVNLLCDNAFLGIAALGATFVILSGGIDLSVGAVIAATSVLVAAMIEHAGAHPLVAIPVALALGALFGLGMGALIHFFDLPPFLVTLAGMFFARGMGFVIHPESIGIKHDFVLNTVNQAWSIALTERVDLKSIAVAWLVLFALAWFLLRFTRFGRNVYAIGGDEESARFMGLPIGRSKLLIYTLAGLFSASAGVVYACYTGSGDPTAASGLELEVIASVVIGGTLLTGGVGFIGGTLIGVLILGLIQTLITFQGDLNSWWTKIFIGALVLLFILLQNLVSRVARRERSA